MTAHGSFAPKEYSSKPECKKHCYHSDHTREASSFGANTTYYTVYVCCHCGKEVEEYSHTDETVKADKIDMEIARFWG